MDLNSLEHEITPHNEEYNQVVNKLDMAMRLSQIHWQDTTTSVSSYLKTHVQVVDFDQLLTCDENTFFSVVNAQLDDDGKPFFPDPQNASLFSPHLTNGREKLYANIEDRLSTACENGILSENQINRELLATLSKDNKDLAIFFSSTIIQKTATTPQQVYAAEIGHIIAKSFGIDLPPQIEEAMDRVCQTVIDIPPPSLSEHDQWRVEQQRLVERDLIQQYHNDYEGCATIREVHERKLRSAVGDVVAKNLLKTNKHVQETFSRFADDPVPSIEQFLAQDKILSTFTGSFNGISMETAHLEGDYIVQEVFQALGGNQAAKERLPIIFINMFKLKKSNDPKIRFLGIDDTINSIVENLDVLGAT